MRAEQDLTLPIGRPRVAPLVTALEWVLITLVVLLVATVSIQVISRLFLTRPALWTVDYATLFLIWSTLLGAALATHRRDHFVVELGPTSDGPWHRSMSLLASGLTLVVLAVLVFISADYTWSARNRTSGMTEISMLYYLSALPIGSFLMLIFEGNWFLASLRKRATREPGLKPISEGEE